MSTAPLDKPTCARLLEALGLADGGEKAAWALTRVGEVLEAFASDDFWNTPPARAAAMRVEARRIAHAAQKLAESLRDAPPLVRGLLSVRLAKSDTLDVVRLPRRLDALVREAERLAAAVRDRKRTRADAWRRDRLAVRLSRVFSACHEISNRLEVPAYRVAFVQAAAAAVGVDLGEDHLRRLVARRRRVGASSPVTRS